MRFLIRDDSTEYAHATFEYPVDVIIRPTGEKVIPHELEHERLEVLQGCVRTLDGRVADDLVFRVRHVGGSIYTGDSIIVSAIMDGELLPVGWFGLIPLTDPGPPARSETARRRTLLISLAVLLCGLLLAVGAFAWGNHPYYGLSLISPVFLILSYLGLYGGGLAAIVGAGMAGRELLRR